MTTVNTYVQLVKSKGTLVGPAGGLAAGTNYVVYIDMRDVTNKPVTHASIQLAVLTSGQIDSVTVQRSNDDVTAAETQASSPTWPTNLSPDNGSTPPTPIVNGTPADFLPDTPFVWQVLTLVSNSGCGQVEITGTGSRAS